MVGVVRVKGLPRLVATVPITLPAPSSILFATAARVAGVPSKSSTSSVALIVKVASALNALCEIAVIVCAVPPPSVKVNGSVALANVIAPPLLIFCTGSLNWTRNWFGVARFTGATLEIVGAEVSIRIAGVWNTGIAGDVPLVTMAFAAMLIRNELLFVTPDVSDFNTIKYTSSLANVGAVSGVIVNALLAPYTGLAASVICVSPAPFSPNPGDPPSFQSETPPPLVARSRSSDDVAPLAGHVGVPSTAVNDVVIDVSVFVFSLLPN